MCMHTCAASCTHPMDHNYTMPYRIAGGTLASSSADKTVRLWAPRRRAAAPPPHEASTPAAASPSGPAGPSPAPQPPLPQQQQQQGMTNDYSCVGVLEDSHSKTIRSCSWSHDGRHLATAGFDGVTAIWERQGGAWESVSGYAPAAACQFGGGGCFIIVGVTIRSVIGCVIPLLPSTPAPRGNLKRTVPTLPCYLVHVIRGLPGCWGLSVWGVF